MPLFRTWLDPLVRVAETVRGSDLSPVPPPPTGGRAAAVLLLFWERRVRGRLRPADRAVRRPAQPRRPARVPGRRARPGDAGPAAAALREAVEETGLDADGVEVFAVLPDLFIPHSGFVVSPVLAWWREPSAVGVVDPGEVAAVHRVPVADLVDPANR